MIAAKGLEPLVGQTLSPSEAMRFAILQGARGTGFVAPNPLVGCVIVDRDHKFLASGFHAKLGGDHAEAAALKNLGDLKKVAGSHIYVTLEPCAHQGRTPSCAHTLAPLKPASVTYAVADPNPIAEHGAKILRAAGVTTSLFSKREDVSNEDRAQRTEDAEDLAEIFLHNHRSKEIFVGLKVATSLDGQMALRTGESKWITSEAAREHTQTVRAKYDAIAVGCGTFSADNPSLNVRHKDFPDFQNKAIVFDSKGSVFGTLRDSNLLKVRPPESVVVVIGEGASQPANSFGVRVLQVPTTGGVFKMDILLQALKSESLTSILIEGGAGTYGAFMTAKKIQRIHAYIAPSIIGAKTGLSWTAAFGINSLAEKETLRRVRTELVLPDIYVSGVLGK